MAEITCRGRFGGILLVRDVEAVESEAEELDRLAKETRDKCVSWKGLKAELGL